MFGKLLIPLAAVCLLSGCDSESGIPGQSGTQTAANSGIEFQLPDKIRTSLMVDFSQVKGFVNVNGRVFEMQPQGNQYRAEVPGVPANSDVSISVEYRERLSDGRELILAGMDQPQIFSVGSENQQIQIREEQYSYGFDADGDEISNIRERNDGTDPFTPENAGTRTVSVDFNLPLRINDPAVTNVVAVIADNPRNFSRDGNFVRVAGVVSAANTIDIVIRLRQQYDGLPLTIAIAKRTIPAGAQNIALTFTDTDFDFEIDNDRDGIFNIDELQGGTDPFTAN